MMNQGYGVDSGYGMMTQGYGMDVGYKIPKLSKGQILDNMCTFIYANTGVAVTKREKIDEIPQTLRHACTQKGVCHLEPFSFQYPTEMGMVSVPFFFCSSCGKMYYCTDYLQ